ncbi:MAG: CPBP family intramembrane glutamic endopeptidase [Pseudomonadota bacterium]
MFTSRLQGPWRYRDGLVVLLGFFLIYAAFSAAHMLIVRYTIGFAAHVGSAGRPLPGFLLLSQWLKAIALLTAVWWLALQRHQLSWRDLGLVRCSRNWLVLAVVVAVAGFALRLLLAKVMVAALPDWARFMASPYGWFDASWPLMLALMLTTIVITPVAEEIFFRGFLFQWMATHRPVWLAMLISSLIFGVSHLMPAQAISTALMSLLIVLLYLGSRSLWPCIVCHVVNNALGMLLGMAAVQGLLPAALTPP